MKSLTSYRFYWLVLLVASFSLVKCSSSKLATDDTNYSYDTKIKDIDPSYLVFHETADTSYLYLSVLTSNLLYVRENSTKPFESELIIKYQLFEDSKGKVLLDSATKKLYDYKTSNSPKSILARVPFLLPLGKTAFLKVETIDVNKKVKDKLVVEVNKKDTKSSQFFMFKKPGTHQIYFDTYFTNETEVEVFSEFNNGEEFRIDYFNTDFPPSAPPFSSNQNIEIATVRDSGYTIQLEQNRSIVTLNKIGSFYLRHADSSKYSVILQKLDANFKGLESYIGMIEPLKYICTSKEYQALENAEDKRKAVESLWLKMAGSKERARIVIEEYYERVEQANKFFTSYKEGWKTDRGMLSIVMGLPNTIYKTRNGETWVYGTPHNMMMSLTFSFNLENEERVSNDYQLTRFRTYRDYWYRACESWRQGRIYNFN